MFREYSDFNRLDPRLFKAFLAAAECENFTQAAKRAAMTQSGVSQQVAKLEEQIGVPLFKRINKSVLLTESGKRLVGYIDSYLDGMDSFFEDISETERQLQGRVSYAMPNSCLLSPHLGMMLDKRKSSPAIELDIRIQSNDLVYEDVLHASVDFGFVTQLKPNPALEYISFCQEEFILVGNKNFRKAAIDPDFLKSTGFVSFPGMDVYFNTWLKSCYPRLKNFNFDYLKVLASISQLDGVITLLKAGVGVSALPKHCVMEQLDKKTLFELRAPSNKKPCFNDIYIIYPKETTLSKRCQRVIDWFLEMK